MGKTLLSSEKGLTMVLISVSNQHDMEHYQARQNGKMDLVYHNKTCSMVADS